MNYEMLTYIPMRTSHKGNFLILVLVLLFALGCGSSADLKESDQNAVDIQDENPIQILRPESLFSVDDVVGAGWKKSKELSSETLPEAIGAWYGFYDHRDVEVRQYKTHESVLSAGIVPADEATGRGKPAPFAVGGISATRTSYSTYAIVGNLILLCEIKIEDCQNLLDAIN
tara:strand:+ start:620 stop:1135 length:516 start_codon:yes stop_codon:yes gene_type:complete